MIQNSWLLYGIIFACAGLAIWLGNNTKWGRYLGYVNLAILSGVILVNLGIMPKSDASYSTVMSKFIPVGIVMMLFMCDLRKLGKCGPKMLMVMLVMILIMIGGGLVTGLLFNTSPESWKLWACATSNNVGNLQTFAGTAASMGLSEHNTIMFTTASNTYWVMYSLLTYLVGRSFISKWLVSYKDQLGGGSTFTEEENQRALAEMGSKEKKLHIDEVAIVFGTAVLVAGVGNWLGEVTGFYPIVFYATIGILIANFTPIRKFVVNDYTASFIFCMYMFTLGCTAHWSTFAGADLSVFGGVFFFNTLSIVLIILVAKLFKFPWEYALLAHCACLGGPIATPPLAKYYKWTDLVLPAVIIAVLGQAVGAYCGVFTGTLLQAILG